MTKIQETVEHICDHCAKRYTSESYFLRHICEQKRRWLDKDKPANRIGYLFWVSYYEKHHSTKKSLTYKDFLKNAYFKGFVSFAKYCIDIDALNPQMFLTYLLKKQIPMHNWTSDMLYSNYLIDYLHLENSMDAVKRTLVYLMDLVQIENIQLVDVFRYVNQNKLCYLIVKGKISPWVLYLADTGSAFLSSLNNDQTNLIFDYINPDKWKKIFDNDREQTAEVKELLRKIPL